MPEKPNRLSVAHIYLKRGIRWHRNSNPFLSGDAFAQLSDVQFGKPRFHGNEPNLKEISDAEVIFVPSDYLQEVLTRFKGRLRPKVILTGNSDYEFHSMPEDIPSTVKLLLLQNSFISDGKRIETLPIGIENLRWGVNGHPSLMKVLPDQNMENRVMIGPFGPTHEIRDRVLREFSEVNGPWKIFDKRLSPDQYVANMAQHTHIAAVRGNGEDTHRLWETLYRGRSPILVENEWSNSLRKFNLPINFIEFWNPDLVRNSVRNKDLFTIDPSRYGPLWIPYWKEKIANSI
jgi:hypothetical protein